VVAEAEWESLWTIFALAIRCGTGTFAKRLMDLVTEAALMGRDKNHMRNKNDVIIERSCVVISQCRANISDFVHRTRPEVPCLEGCKERAGDSPVFLGAAMHMWRRTSAFSVLY
jgi:hypothetical protein